MSSGETRTAAEWMARLRGERATQEDRNVFERWLDLCPENRASAATIEQIWWWIGALENDPIVRDVLERRHD